MVRGLDLLNYMLVPRWLYRKSVSIKPPFFVSPVQLGIPSLSIFLSKLFTYPSSAVSLFYILIVVNTI